MAEAGGGKPLNGDGGLGRAWEGYTQRILNAH